MSAEQNLPSKIDLDTDLVWKRQVPAGVSSPIVVDFRVVLTGADGEELVVVCVDAKTGRQLWKRVAPRSRREIFNPRHGPATPTPVSDGEAIYAFFPDFGLLAYSLDGDELWRRELDSFSSVQGMASSPVYSDGKLALLVDQTVGAYLAVFDAKTGRELWRKERPTNFLGSYATPVIYEPDDGPVQIIAAGSVELASYQLSTGEVLWRNPGWLAPAGSPSVADGVVYASEPMMKEAPPFSAMKPFDTDGDGALSREEAGGEGGLVFLIDRLDIDHGDGDGKAEADEWAAAFSTVEGNGGLRALKLDGSGAQVWRRDPSVPAQSSVLVYEGLVYAVNQSAVLTVLDAVSGEEVKQGRLRDALGDYSASPVAGDGKVYFASMEGKISIVEAGRDWSVVSTVDLGERIQATPALADGSVFVRSDMTLWRLGRKPAQ